MIIILTRQDLNGNKRTEPIENLEMKDFAYIEAIELAKANYIVFVEGYNYMKPHFRFKEIKSAYGNKSSGENLSFEDLAEYLGQITELEMN